MYQYLLWIPAITSVVLGAVYLVYEDARPLFKIAGVVVFAVALYLQFLSEYSLTGLLLQSALALYLALWRKLTASS